MTSVGYGYINHNEKDESPTFFNFFSESQMTPSTIKKKRGGEKMSL